MLTRSRSGWVTRAILPRRTPVFSSAGSPLLAEGHSLVVAGTFVDFEHGLNTAIKSVRQALGDSADNPRFIETLPRKGYRFIAPVEALAIRCRKTARSGSARSPANTPGSGG